jgi:ribosomal-protein-alanine acetyltransferase
MRHRNAKRRTELVIIWEFHVKPGNARAFEKTYSPGGRWVEFLRRSEDYIRTELIRDREKPRRYLTIDVWRSRQAYAEFKEKHRAEYRATDKKCQSLNRSERLVGEFLRRRPADSFRLSRVGGLSVGGARFSSIRRATVADVSEMVALERASPSAAHWPESAYLQIFGKSIPTRIALVVAAGKNARRMHGFVIARVADGDCELENIVVARKRQRNGLGSRLMYALAIAARDQHATRIFLEVRKSNAAAQRLYENCGFTLSGCRPAYYADPSEDAILYALSL